MLGKGIDLNDIIWDFTHNIDFEAIFATLQTKFRHFPNYLSGFLNSPTEGNHELNIGKPTALVPFIAAHSSAKPST